jgi:predicted HTH transcriptional regulator
MAIKNVDDLIRTFAMDLQALVRDQLSSEVNAAVQAALGGKPVKGAKFTATKRGRNGKRTPAEIEKDAAKLLTYIAKNADQRAEQIAKANGLTTAELVRPIKRLLTEKKIKASGKARGTNYAIAK